MAQKQREVYLDLTKLAAIYLVLLGHCLGILNQDLTAGGMMMSIIYSFHMPLFMFVSGYFASSVLRNSFSEMLRRKTCQLLVPAISCTVVCIIFQALIGKYNFRVEIIGNSWFLKTLLFNFIVFYLLKQLQLPDWLLAIGSTVVIWLIPHSYSLYVSYLFPFFWGGYLWRKHSQVINQHKLTIAISSSITFIGLTFLRFYENIDTNMLVAAQAIREAPLGVLMKYLLAFSGTIAIVEGLHVLCSHWRVGTLRKVSVLGQYTLGIYVIQTFLLVNVFLTFYHGDINNPWILNLLCAPALSIVVLLVSVLFIKLCSRQKLLDLVFFGGQYGKNLNSKSK